MQHADVRRDFVLVIMQELNEEIISVLAEGFKRLEKQAQDALKEEGFGRKNTEFGYELDLHYEGQQWDVRVALAPDAPPAEIRKAFEEEYDRQFGHTNPESRINVAKVRVVGIGVLPPLQDPKFDAVTSVAEPSEMRRVYAEAEGVFLDTPVYQGGDLQNGHKFQGPAIIEEATTTVVVGPNDNVAVDALNNYIITFEARD